MPLHLPGAEVAQRELDRSGSAPAGERQVVRQIGETVKRLLIALVLVTLPDGASSERDDAFQVLPSIVDADTTRREERVVEIPHDFMCGDSLGDLSSRRILLRS